MTATTLAQTDPRELADPEAEPACSVTPWPNVISDRGPMRAAFSQRRAVRNRPLVSWSGKSWEYQPLYIWGRPAPLVARRDRASAPGPWLRRSVAQFFPPSDSPEPSRWCLRPSSLHRTPKKDVHYLLTTPRLPVRIEHAFARHREHVRSRMLENKQEEDSTVQTHPVVHSLLERLAPPGSGPASERIWRFSERMATVYEEQMRQFDEDAEAREWRRLYSADNLPPPSDTQNMADVAAMMAFYSPTNFCKFQKLLVQQLLDWESRQASLNPYPLGAPSITIVDIGAGAGIASLATIDVLAKWTEVLAELGYKQLGISIRVVSVEPDAKKQGPRQRMLGSLSHLLDVHSIAVERVTEVIASYPEPECIRQILKRLRAARWHYAACPTSCPALAQTSVKCRSRSRCTSEASLLAPRSTRARSWNEAKPKNWRRTQRITPKRRRSC